MNPPAWLVCALLAAAVGATGAARAESALTLPSPDLLGDVAAFTYDEEGERVGDASIAFESLGEDRFLLRGISGIDGSARADVRAEFVRSDDGSGLRLLHQQTEAHDENGRSLGVMTIDHRDRLAVCGVPEGSEKQPVNVELPPEDRVVNVPLNLLFQPLVTGEAEEIDFQVLLCRVGARLVDARARVAENGASPESRLVEVRYSLDFGPILSRLAAPFMPRLSFWFDGSSPGDWVGHRMPLFSKGPTVLVVRSGFSPSVFGPAE
jgi:hypothetical protein